MKRMQSKAYNIDRENASKKDSDTAMIHMDFAENFTCNYQDEVASAHWRSTSVTIYKTMLWFRENSVPMVIVSDNKDHNKNTVVPYS